MRGRTAAAGVAAASLPFALLASMAAPALAAPARPAVTVARVASGQPATAATAAAPQSPIPVAGGAAREITRPGPVGGPQLGGRGVVVNYPPGGGPRLPYVPATSYVIADAGTGQVLAAKDPHGWLRPASTLKVLTAITLMPALGPDATVVASHQAAVVTPSKVGLIQGDSYRVSDLFRALLMISANDAAIALADATGSYAKGIAMMNAEAHHLQADDTVAKTPNGLDAKGQHASAYDLALFARQALAIPQFMQDEATRVAKFPLQPHHRPVTLWNQNTMLDTYPGDLGGKIGWTTAAETTFIGWAQRHGTTLIVTIMHVTPLTEMNYAAQLLNWGFAMDGKVRPVGTLVPPLPEVTAARPRPGRPARALPRATAGLPSAAIAGGVTALALGLLITAAVMLSARRRRTAHGRGGGTGNGGQGGGPYSGSGSGPGTGRLSR